MIFIFLSNEHSYNLYFAAKWMDAWMDGCIDGWIPCSKWWCVLLTTLEILRQISNNFISLTFSTFHVFVDIYFEDKLIASMASRDEYFNSGRILPTRFPLPFTRWKLQSVLNVNATDPFNFDTLVFALWRKIHSNS